MAETIMRCAVYTRKSTEDGLEQEFNSLDAQFEACAAYALSQRHEGWMVIPDRYDDGGFSGGNIQRPAMQRLMADVAAGKIDIILIYKIDRLTRSLADFAKIVEVLDKAGASFVSITQSFNTTTSMGRLTLNMLLSFAQFEREVTGERIRDKIAASKRKGIWMGGIVPLGYNVEARKLVVNEPEAELVRHIFERYLVVTSVEDLADELNREGHRTKLQNNASGPHRGGCNFRRGTLYHMLANVIYTGRLTHKDESFPGEHAAIVTKPLWDAVSAKLKGSASGTSRRLKAQQPSLLTGLVYDGEGRAMTPTHATKPGKRYRYYTTRPDQLDQTPAWRVSAHDLENLVCERVSDMLSDQLALVNLAGAIPADDIRRLLTKADVTAAVMRSGSAMEKAELLAALINRINLRKSGIDLTIARHKLVACLGLDAQFTDTGEALILSLPIVRVRHGHQLRLIIPGPQTIKIDPVRRDVKLVALLAEAHVARQLVLANADTSMNALAATHGRCRTRLAKLAALSCMAPDIVTAIIEGSQPPELTARTLLEMALPAAWPEQRVMLGFG